MLFVIHRPRSKPRRRSLAIALTAMISAVMVLPIVAIPANAAATGNHVPGPGGKEAYFTAGYKTVPGASSESAITVHNPYSDFCYDASAYQKGNAYNSVVNFSNNYFLTLYQDSLCLVPSESISASKGDQISTQRSFRAVKFTQKPQVVLPLVDLGLQPTLNRSTATVKVIINFLVLTLTKPVFNDCIQVSQNRFSNDNPNLGATAVLVTTVGTGILTAYTDKNCGKPMSTVPLQGLSAISSEATILSIKFRP
ncbi:hypothetical protein [Psychromicrobium sp. YIM B11713]|uniref:hypothetical protein n=1 Tax=Psychromicrobium sp. YIM B11713 TaxID=3145233 RepID=UPI00374E2275